MLNFFFGAPPPHNEHTRTQISLRWLMEDQQLQYNIVPCYQIINSHSHIPDEQSMSFFGFSTETIK